MASLACGKASAAAFSGVSWIAGAYGQERRSAGPRQAGGLTGVEMHTAGDVQRRARALAGEPMRFKAERLAIRDVILVTPHRIVDARGYFMETYRASDFAGLGVAAAFVQDNHVMSAERGTMRGLHFQRPPQAQAKLVRAVRGAIFDVAVDLREGSPATAAGWAATLRREGGEQLFVPRGFAHGYCTLEPATRGRLQVRRLLRRRARGRLSLRRSDAGHRLAGRGGRGRAVRARTARCRRLQISPPPFGT